MKKKILLSIILTVLLASVGCIHKASGPVTPMEKISTDWAVLAEFLQTAEAGTQAAVTSGVITTAQARPIIQFELQVAQNQQALTPVIQQGQTAITSSTALQSFLTSVGTQAQALVKLDVTNPKTQQPISADIAFITSLANVVIGDISALKGAA